MKKTLCTISLFVLIIIYFSTVSCHKSDVAPGKSVKYQIVAGAWNQSDIVLGVPVSVKVGGQKYTFAAGTSVITNATLKALGVTALFKPTASNVYNFSDSGSYTITGTTGVILPVAGSGGTWSLDVYDAVLKLTSTTNVNDPHWINAISSDSLSLAMTVNIPGLGAAPLSLLLKKK